MTPDQRDRILAGIEDIQRRHAETAARGFISQRELMEFRDAAGAERVWVVSQPGYSSTHGPLGLYAVFMDDLAVALDELVNVAGAREPDAPFLPGPAVPQNRIAAVVVDGLPALKAVVVDV